MHATIADKPAGYMLPVGDTDRLRLDALGVIHNAKSLDLITTHCTKKNPKILDVGCGNGTLTCLFAKTIIGSTVVGVDMSPAQIEVSKKKSSEEQLDNVTWEVCDVYHLEKLKEKHPGLFDVVHSRFLLTHVPELSKAVDQMLSMVKPGGFLILEEVGAKKKFKNTPIKAIQAWKNMVDLQHQMQKSNPDTVEKVLEHLSHSDKIATYSSQLFNIVIEGQLKKSMFRMGAEHGIKILTNLGKPELIKSFGYEDGETWLKDMRDFENDDSITLEIVDNEDIIAIKAL